MNPSHPRTTPLEHFQMGGDGARLELEGQPIELRGEGRDAAAEAFRAFYQSALEDFRARREPPPRPGLFQRVRSWFARLLGARGSAPSAGGPWPASRGEAAPVRSPALPTPPAPDPAPAPLPAEKPSRRSPAPAEAARAPSSAVRAAPEPGEPPPPLLRPADRSAPQLRAAFADREGVHLLWQDPGHRAAEGKVTLTYALDSAVAQQLQGCYQQLSRLGYRVVGLELLQPKVAPAAADPTHSPGTETPAPIPETPKVAAKIAGAADVARGPAVEKKERTLVMRLHPAAPEEPHRAIVAPVENAENLQVLVAPERLVRALYAAADAGQPADQRVTYLRCALGKAGLKVVDVGVGEGREQGPARWEEVAAWWEAAQPRPEAAKKLPRSVSPAEPVGAAEPSLFP
jgi:hypothetical protein